MRVRVTRSRALGAHLIQLSASPLPWPSFLDYISLFPTRFLFDHNHIWAASDLLRCHQLTLEIMHTIAIWPRTAIYRILLCTNERNTP